MVRRRVMISWGKAMVLLRDIYFYRTTRELRIKLLLTLVS